MTAEARYFRFYGSSFFATDAKPEDYAWHDSAWHCNRQAFASRLVMAGVDLRMAAQFMGHRLAKAARVAELADAPDLGCDMSSVTALVRGAAWNGKHVKISAKSSSSDDSPVTISSH